MSDNKSFMPPLRVTWDTGEHTIVHPRQSDVVRIERHTQTAVFRIEWGHENTMRLAHVALRRLGDARAPEDFDAFIDLATVEVAPEVKAQGKALVRARSTGR